jgi:WhiB family redox-sensing transcriptional regulator
MDIEFQTRPETDNTWKDAGLCSGMTQVFFGPASERPERRREREVLARSICGGCPVMMECLSAGRLNHEHGIWGGENDEERALAGHTPRSPSRRSVIAAQKIASKTRRTEEDTATEILAALAS